MQGTPPVGSRTLTYGRDSASTRLVPRPDRTLRRLARLLSAEERERAARMDFAEHRARLVAARGLLRSVLGRYLGAEPADLELCRTPAGKPELAGGGDAPPIRFNCSHSAGLAVYAVARGRRVGVDVEDRRAVPRVLDVAAAVLTPAEQESLRRLPEDRRSAAFLTRWTRVEARLKASGAGLGGAADERAEACRWSLAPLWPADGFVGAVAVEGSGWGLTTGRWPPA